MKFNNIYMLLLAALMLAQCTPKVAEQITTTTDDVKETMTQVDPAQAWRSEVPTAGPARQLSLIHI